MDISEVFYHGIREQVKRVVGLLGEERTEAGMSAFVDGASSWSHCFFARALMPERLGNEYDVARLLGLQRDNGTLNLVPVRLVYQTFDGLSSMISKDDLRTMLRELLEESYDDLRVPETSTTVKDANAWLAKTSGQNLLDMLKKISFSTDKPAQFEGPSCAT